MADQKAEEDNAQGISKEQSNKVKPNVVSSNQDENEVELTISSSGRLLNMNPEETSKALSSLTVKVRKNKLGDASNAMLRQSFRSLVHPDLQDKADLHNSPTEEITKQVKAGVPLVARASESDSSADDDDEITVITSTS